jgi:hypothetical protein
MFLHFNTLAFPLFAETNCARVTKQQTKACRLRADDIARLLRGGSARCSWFQWLTL